MKETAYIESRLFRLLSRYTANMSKETPGIRYAEIEQDSPACRIRVVLDLDGESKATVDTGIRYFDNLLGVFAYDGLLDLGVSIEGSQNATLNDRMESIGAGVGAAIHQAIGETDHLNGFGSALAPSGEALILVAVDISGQPFVQYNLESLKQKVEDLPLETIPVFLRSLAAHAGLTIHVHPIAGENPYYLCESLFKGLGRAIHRATQKLEPKRR